MRLTEALAMAGLGGLVGGVLSAVLTVWLVSPKKAPKVEREQATEAASAAGSSLDDRVSSLETSVKRLRSGSPSFVFTTPPAGSAAGNAGDQQGDTDDGDPVIDNPVFEAAVRDLVDRVQEEREAERELERSERRRQWSQQWATDLSTPLKLNDAQKTKMQEIANQFWDRLRDMRNSDAGSPPSRQERRAQMSALREEAEGKIAGVLDASQLDTYSNLEGEQRLGGRFGRDFARRRPGRGD
jgi:hypothetical protein